MAVRVSPDGRRVLKKIRHETTFELIVQDVENRETRIRTISSETQMALSFAPDANAIAYLSRPNAGEPFRAYIWDLTRNRIDELPIPVSEQASAPIQWSERGDRFLYTANRNKANRLHLVILKPTISKRDIGIITGTRAYSWSPDGSEFLASMADSPGAIAIWDASEHLREKLPLPSAEQIDSFGWAKSQRQIVVSLRKSGEEWLRLVQIDRRSHLAEDCLSADADLRSPIPLPDAQFAFQIAKEAKSVLGRAACNSRPQIIGPNDGVIEPHFLSGKELYGLYSGPERPPALVAVDTSTSKVRTIYEPPDGAVAAIGAPKRIRIPIQGEGTIPGLLWNSRKRNGSVVVNAHGGPHLQDTAQWDLLTSILINAGADYLTSNYHGTPGYGYSFGQSEDVQQHVREVVATCEYAVLHLRPRTGRVILVGASYGAYLAALAAQRRPDLIESVALMSMLQAPRGVAPSQTLPRVHMLQFHGANDDVLSAEEARQATEMLLGRGATSPPYGCFHVFDGEGHTIWRTLNVARMYGAIAGLVRGDVPMSAK